jgi:hypothetical protein
MTKNNLARLEPVSLREAWSSESSDFTPWLAQEENLKLLGETIGLDLELEKQEHAVDQYRADIVCKELENNQRVVIENQIEDTDHKHLGQILTYAAGVDASFLIWVAQKFTDAHREALHWLNEQANGSVSYFGIEIELYRIGNSPLAPRFNVVSKPNDWANRVKQSVNEGEFNETEKIRLKYWTAMIAALKTANSSFNCYKPAAKSYLKIKPPISGYSTGFEVYVPDERIGVYFGSYNSEQIEELRRLVLDHKAALEKEVGEAIELTDNGENKRFWIELIVNSNPRKESDWPRQHEWLRATLEKLIAAVAKRLAPQN